MKKILFALLMIVIQNFAICQKSMEAYPKTDPRSGKETASGDKPGCSPNSYFPLCGNMTYTYQETDATGMRYEKKITYKYFNTIKKNGRVYYGYTVHGEQSGTDGNVYYNYENGVLTEYYEIPDINTEYLGSSMGVANIFKAPSWSNTEVVNFYQTDINYNTGNFRGVLILKVNDMVGSTWTNKSIVDMKPAEITHTIIAKQPVLKLPNGKVYNDVMILQRKTITYSEPPQYATSEIWRHYDITNQKSSQELVSLQQITYAKGIGIIQIADINRKHFMSDFVRPSRFLSSFQSSPAQKANVYAGEGIGLARVKEIESREEKELAAKSKAMAERDIALENIKRSMKGKLDTSIFGTWKSNKNNFITYLKFFEDGTYELYAGTTEPKNLLEKYIWRINGKSLERVTIEINSFGQKILIDANNLSNVQKLPIQKINASGDNRRMIILQGKTFYCLENTNPFSNSEKTD